MRAECFKRYVGCVLEADYWAIAHDLDCALDLVGCGYDVIWGRMAEGDTAEAQDSRGVGRENARAALERHTDELQQFGNRIRELGAQADNDEKLEKDLDRFLKKIEQEARKQA